MKIFWNIILVFLWISTAGALFSTAEQEYIDDRLAANPSGEAGYVFGTIVLWVLLLAITAILIKSVYDFFNKKESE